MSIVNKIFAEAKLSELFGFSQKEKQAKVLQAKVLQAKKEIENYRFENLFAQTGTGLERDKEIEQMRQLVKGILIRSAQEMPTFAELFPDMFKFNGCSTCVYDYKGKELYGVFPPMWQIAVQHSMFIPERAKQFALDKLKNLN